MSYTVTEYERPLFVALGHAVYRALLLETRVAYRLARPDGLEVIPSEEYERRAARYRGWPLGRLVGELKKRPECLTEEQVGLLDERVKDRKRLVHHLLWDHAVAALHTQGRDALIAEMDAIAQRFESATEMVKAADSEWLQRRGSPHPRSFGDPR